MFHCHFAKNFYRLHFFACVNLDGMSLTLAPAVRICASFDFELCSLVCWSEVSAEFRIPFDSMTPIRIAFLSFLTHLWSNCQIDYEQEIDVMLTMREYRVILLDCIAQAACVVSAQSVSVTTDNCAIRPTRLSSQPRDP